MLKEQGKSYSLCHCLATQPQAMANVSYFRFDEDFEIQYKYSHNIQKGSGQADDTQSYILQNISWSEWT